MLLGHGYTPRHAHRFRSGCLAPWVLQRSSHSEVSPSATGEIKADNPKKRGWGLLPSAGDDVR